MTQTLEQFISQRRKDLLEEIEPLRERLRVLDEELSQIDLAAAAIQNRPHGQTHPPVAGAVTTRSPRGAIKRAVVETLAANQNGLDAMSILIDINKRLGGDYERTSLSPQLSRLKTDGVVTLDGNIWKLIRNPLVSAIPVPTHELDDDEPDESAIAKTGSAFGK